MASSESVIRLRGLGKVYERGSLRVEALKPLTLCIAYGEYVAIMGPSGSGKSTLMNILGLLDRPSSGEYLFDGTSVAELDEEALAKLRNRGLGFVFQSFNLLPRQSALENVELPMLYAGVASALRRERALEALGRVGLAERVNHRPTELSGGQQQRVAIARALVNTPQLILADEPTGNLDSRSGEEVMAIFDELNVQGITVILVTHEEEVAQHSRRVLRFRDGDLMVDEALAKEAVPVLEAELEAGPEPQEEVAAG